MIDSGEPAALRAALAERDAARREIKRLRLQREMLLAIGGTMELATLLALLKKEMLGIRGVDGVVIALLDEQGDHLVVKDLTYPEEYRSLEGTFLNYKIPLDESRNPHIRALLERAPVISDSLSGDTDVKLTLSRWKLRQSVALPIAVEGEGVGSVMLLCQQKALPGAAQERALELIGLFGHSLSHAVLYDRLNQQKQLYEAAANEQERFLQFVVDVNNLTLPDHIYGMIGAELMRRMPFDVAAVFMARDGWLQCCRTVPKSEFFAPQAAAFQRVCDDDPIRIDVMEGGVPIAFVRDIPMVFPDARLMMDLPMAEKAKNALASLGTPRTLVNMPIRAKGKPIGVLFMVSLVQPCAVSKEDLRLLDHLSAFFGSAISNATTYELAEGQRREIERLNLILQDRVEELADQMATDKLTGLYNFRAFEQELQRRVNECERECQGNAPPEGLSIVIADIDHFKRFNDRYGHAAGNVVLAGVAREMAQLSRKMDMACRYGGEEFVVILPKCDTEGALIFAERLRIAVENARFRLDSGEETGVTVSVGVASFVAGDSHEALFERADRALYRAKRGGRNQVRS